MKFFSVNARRSFCLLALCAAMLWVLQAGLALAAPGAEPVADNAGIGQPAPDAEAEAEADEETPAEPPAEPARPTGTTVVNNTATLTLDSKQAIVHGAPVTIDAAPFATNNTTMLPLRFIAQDILGAEVVWDNDANLVRIKREAISITVDLAYGKVYYDGEPYAMPVKPMVKDNRTLVPLRLITELMNCQVQYTPDTKQILIVLPEILKVDPPVADIVYMPATAGQTVEYLDNSYDPAGYEITEREWEVTDARGVTKTGPSLYWLFYQRQGGDYHIVYRVKNSYGIWSYPVETDYYLEVNNPPEITEFEAPELSVDIGQTLNISYDYANEDWEDIAAVNFSYSWQDSTGTEITKKGLPAAFFTPGRHTVTLSLQDAFGLQSEEKQLIFDVSDTVLATETEYRFNNLNPGEIYLNFAKKNFNGLLSATTKRAAKENITLIDSNSPEKVSGPSLLYKDTVSGRTTVHYHHLNNSSLPLKFYIVAHNESAAPVTYTLGRRGFAGPSTDAMQVGYIENQNYLSSVSGGQTVTLQPGQMALLNSAQTAAVSPGCLQSALVDLQIEGKLTVAIVAMDTTAAYRDYRKLAAADSVPPQTRGTYTNAAYNIDIQLGDTPEKVMLGYPDSFSGLIEDYLVAGYDKLSNTPTYNKGNYGVVHTIKLTATEDTGILVNPRGSIYRGAILWNNELCLLSANGQIKTPQESVIAGVIRAGETVTITYITPDGSDSPALLVALPKSYWSKY